MNLSFAIPTALDYFGTLVDSDRDFALFEAAVSLGQDEYPAMDMQAVLGEMDLLLARLKKRLPADAGPVQKLRILNQFFYGDLGFGGNLNDFYDPDNSYVHRVLATRRGIPVALAVLWMELAQGLGLAARGVGFPGHFLIKINLPMGQVVIDPVNGQSLSREELSERLEPYRRSGLHEAMDAPLGLFLQTAASRDIITRMLRNLKEIFKSRNDWQRLLAVQERLIVLLPECWSEYRDRGLAHAELGNTEQALADLECYLVHADESGDSDTVADWVDVLRRS